MHFSPVEITMNNHPNTLMETVSSELVQLKGGDLYQVTKFKDRKYRTAPYLCIGRNGSTPYFNPSTQRRVYTEGLDVTQIFVQLNSISLSLFWKLVAIRDYKTNEVNLTNPSLSRADKNRLKKYLKELIDHQLICRIKQGYLLINPKAILPDFKSYESVEFRWNQLVLEQKLKNATTTMPLPSKPLKLELLPTGVMDSPIEFNELSMEDDVPRVTLRKELKLTL